MLRVLALLLLAAPVLAKDPKLPAPLQTFARLLGGSWIFDGRLPGRRANRHRLVVEAGRPATYVRMRSTVVTGDKETLFYDAYIYLRHGEKELRYIMFAAPGGVARGLATTKERLIVLRQPRQGDYPSVHVEFQIDPNSNDACIRRSKVCTDRKWSSNDARGKRVKEVAKNVAFAPAVDSPLEPAARLIGGYWDQSGEWLTGGRVAARARYRWSIPGRVITSVTSIAGKDGAHRPAMTGLHYWDPVKKRIGILLLGRSVSVGHLVIDKNRWDYAWTTYGARGARKMRETMHFTDDDTHTWVAQAERDGQWATVSGTIMNKRVKG